MSADATMTSLRPQRRRHVLSVLVENHHGVLSRISGMFAARGFNIDALTVSETEDATMSRMTVSVFGDDVVVDQIRKQLGKLGEVIVIEDLTELGPHLQRELALVKVRHEPAARFELLQIAASFPARCVDMMPATLTLEVVGGPEDITRFLTMVGQVGVIVELARSGVVALARGPEGLRESFLRGERSA